MNVGQLLQLLAQHADEVPLKIFIPGEGPVNDFMEIEKVERWEDHLLIVAPLDD